MNDFDADLPAGFTDADFETRDLEASARRQAERKKRGICSHGYLLGPPGPLHKPTKIWTCGDCGQTWATEQEAHEAYRR